MPHYNFFEPAKPEHKKVTFQEFNLKTNDTKERASSPSAKQDFSFHPLQMPDMSKQWKPKSCAKA